MHFSEYFRAALLIVNVYNSLVILLHYHSLIITIAITPTIKLFTLFFILLINTILPILIIITIIHRLSNCNFPLAISLRIEWKKIIIVAHYTKTHSGYIHTNILVNHHSLNAIFDSKIIWCVLRKWDKVWIVYSTLHITCQSIS